MQLPTKNHLQEADAIIIIKKGDKLLLVKQFRQNDRLYNIYIYIIYLRNLIMKTNFMIYSYKNVGSAGGDRRRTDANERIQSDRFIHTLQRNLGSPKRYSDRINPDEQYNLTNKNIKHEPKIIQVRKNDINLFTIEQNYYTRKKTNLLSPRPPKYKQTNQRMSSLNEFDPPERNRQKKVLFEDNPIHSESIMSRKQSSSSKPIIKNGTNNSLQDNLSNSSRSLSVQHSLTSQFKSISKNYKPTVDQNRQKYSQIMSFFQKNKQSNRQISKSSKAFAKLSKSKNEQQYTDTLFPPVMSSIYLKNTRNSHSEGERYGEIKWKRLLQLYNAQEIVLINTSGESHFNIVLGQNSFASQFMTIAFNAIKYSNCIIQKIFQDQILNQCGLYLLKIWQYSSWKTVLLDQFIPTRQIKNQDGSIIFKPAFIDIKAESKKHLQIWPFLLEKAYSNYYSTYQFMKYGNTLDFISEIMGLCPVEINLNKKFQKEFINLQSHLESVDSFALGFNPFIKKYYIIRAIYNLQSSFLVYSQSPKFTQSELTLAIFSKLNKIYLYSPKVYHTLSISIIGKYNLNSKQTQRSQYSLRRLILSQNSECLISIQQKQARFFVKSSLNYDYIWIRMILVQRQFNGYRWITGVYAKSKNIVLSSSLSQGEYYLIIMPEWIKTQPFELTLLSWANHSIVVQKQKNNDCEKLIEEACMDLAQRKGKMKQLSPSICSYNYICPDTGFMIENINNQKLKEQIQIHRQILGIPSSVALIPINKQFWPEKNKLVEKIDIKIPKLSSYTIVLKMKGGLDRKMTKIISTEAQQTK